MYLSKIHIENFRLLKKVDIDLDKSLTLIVGKNNTGKTSVMHFLKKVIQSDNKDLFFNDYPIECRRRLYELLSELWQQGKTQTDFFAQIPRTSIKFYVDYSEENDDDSLGALSPFILDILNDKSTQVIIEAVYDPVTDTTIYDDIKKQVLDLGSSKNGVDSHQYLSQILSENFTRLFHLRITSINPSAPEDQKECSLRDLRELFIFKEITAERSLDETDEQNNKPLARIMSQIFSHDFEVLEQELKSSITKLQQYVDKLNLTSQIKIDNLMSKIVKGMMEFGYPSSEDLQLHACTNISLKNQIINNTDLTYTNSALSETLPSTHNGLGYKNLIKISLLLQEFIRNVKLHTAAIPLLYIEEPEAHMHPQLQTTFVSYVTDYVSKVNSGKTVQIVLTSHSSHVANTVPFRQVRYMRKNIDSVDCKNMTAFCEQGNDNARRDNLDFLQKYMKLNYCDLYFCDKAILIEGTSERLLLRDMIEKCKSDHLFKSSPDLASQYYSIIEVGGAHAFKFFDLLEYLQIPALIITDVDYVDDKGKACQIDQAKKTSNATITRWCRDAYNIDSSSSIGIAQILQLQRDDEKKTNGLRHLEFQIQENGAAPRSFEEALMNVNRKMFCIAKSKKVINFDKNKIGKTDFALNLLFHPKFQGYIVPTYIKKGLVWLDAQSKASVIPLRPQNKIST